MDVAQAVCVTTSNQHMRILAGPGAGKTATMVAKCAFHISSGVKPESIVVTTFTNKAAQELKHRLTALVGERAQHIHCGTFHGLALKFLRQYQFGLMGHGEVSVWASAPEMLQVHKGFLVQQNVAWATEAKALANAYSKSRLVVDPGTPPAILKRGVTSIPATVVARGFAHFERYKAENHLVDFDDLLHMWLEFLNSGLSDDMHADMRYFIMDEMQDSNEVQTAIALAFACQGTHVVAVGDDCQSIYGFRGSEIRHIHAFSSLFPGAAEYMLEANYRSTPEIAALCQAIIEYNAIRIPKQIMSTRPLGTTPRLYSLPTARQELEFIAELCGQLRTEGKTCAVLFRTNRGSDAMQAALFKAHVQHSVLKGKSLFEQSHVRDVVSFLRMCMVTMPPQFVVLSVLQLMPRVGKAKATELWAKATQICGVSFIGGLMDLPQEHLPASVIHVLCELNSVVHALRAIQSGEDGAYRAYVKQVGAVAFKVMVPLVKVAYKNYVNVDRYADDIAEVLAMLSSFDTFFDFLDAAGLGECSLQNNGCSLIHVGTIHQSKGLEFGVVVVAGCCEGSIPSPWSKTDEEVEEERRLLYVACSRAQDSLYLTMSQTGGAFVVGGNERSRVLSRFLRPVLDHIDCRTDLPLPPTVSTRGRLISLDEALSNFEAEFGRGNVLYGTLGRVLLWQTVPCELIASPVPQRSNVLQRGGATEKLIQQLAIQCLSGDSIGGWMQQLTPLADDILKWKAYIAVQTLKGSLAFGKQTEPSWPQFMDSLETTCGQLRDGATEVVVGQLLNMELGDGCVVSATIDLVLDQAVLAVTFDTECICGRQVASLLLQAALSAHNQEKRPTTLAILNCVTGELQKSAIPGSLSLPAGILRHPVGQLLSTLVSVSPHASDVPGKVQTFNST